MNDYSDLFFLIAAIAIYGLLVNNTNRSLVLNNQILNDSEIEYGAISVAQDILDEARWMNFKEFKTSNEENTENYLKALNNSTLYEADVEIYDVTSGAGDREIEVTVRSNYLKNTDGTKREITMSLIKTDY